MVVGAGSAGCVVAARLAEAGIPAVLLEAGPADGRIPSPDSAGLIGPERHPDRYWPPLTAVRDPAQREVDGRHEFWMGRGLGGGSAVNGMLVMPGDRADYDRWARIDGCSSWEADSMAPWLAKAAAVLDPEPRAAVAGTEDLLAAFDDAFADIGLGPAGTTLDRDRCGVFNPALATRGGNRRTVADAYLQIGGSDLSIRTGRTVAGLATNGAFVRGVVLADGETVPATTVVLAAGTVGTARLLRTTGLVRHAGDWIRNHAASAVPFPWPTDRVHGSLPQVHRVARWPSNRSTPSASVQSAPDLTAVLMGPFTEPVGPTGIVIVMASTVRSHGHLQWDGEGPRLVSNRLDNSQDLAVLRSGTRTAVAVCRRLAGLAGGNRSVTGRADLDELDRLTDPEFDDWLIRHPGPVHHAVGSCRMGAGHSDVAVTAAEPGRAGTIPGLGGVVVADASLFPDLVAGGLQLPVMAVAERIASETLLAADGLL